MSGQNSRFAKYLQYPQDFIFDNPSVSGTTTKKEWKNRGDRKFKVEQITYNNPTGLAVDTSNFFVVALKNGTTVIGSLSTHDTAIVADTPIDLTLSVTAADLIMAAGDTLTSVLTKTGTQTLPAGRFMVHGKFI